MRYSSFAVFCLLFTLTCGQNGYNYREPEIPQNNYLPPPPAANNGYDYRPPAPPQAPEEAKNIYVHIPPDMVEQSLEIPQITGPPRKHYKIIFVKAPSPPRQPIATPPPVEEKTLVYVLVRKPEGPSEEEIRAAAEQNSLKPSKPEVYFINYKTKKEKLSPLGLYGENGIDVRSGPLGGSEQNLNSFPNLANFAGLSTDFVPPAENFESGSLAGENFSLPNSLTPPSPTADALYGAPNFRH